MERTRYTEAFRKEALIKLELNGGNVNGTAKELGMPEATLRLWANTWTSQSYAADYEAEKDRLAGMFIDLASACCGEMVHKLEDASIGQLATVAGISVDKAQILKGQPNSITEQRGKRSVQAAFRDVAEMLGQPTGPESADPLRKG